VPTAATQAPTNVENSSPTIKLVAVTPKDGITFLMDGKVLRELAIDRPKKGEVKLLTAKAAGFHDEVLRLDEATPDQLDVLLAKSEEPKPEAKPEAKPEPKAASVAPQPVPTEKARPPEAKPKKPPKPDIPDNPF
jgi:hypothetical protein